MKSLSNYTSDRKSNHQKTLVTYVTAGMPNWIDCIQACVDHGADLIEVGLPFSDPIMDGPVIAKASAQALANGAETLTLLKELSECDFSVPLAVMTYANVLYAQGMTEIIAPLQAANVTGVIIPDVTFERRDLISQPFSDTDISLIPLVSSTTSAQRRGDIISSGEGFIYCVAIKGITGEQQSIDTEFIAEVTKQSSLPTFCGVGVRTADDAQAIAPLCDGVIVGTSIVEKMFDDNAAQSIGKFVAEIRQSIDKG